MIGVHFLGLAAVAIFAFVKSENRLFYVIAVSELLIAAGRLISLGVDACDPHVLIPWIIEIYI